MRSNGQTSPSQEEKMAWGAGRFSRQSPLLSVKSISHYLTEPLLPLVSVFLLPEVQESVSQVLSSHLLFHLANIHGALAYVTDMILNIWNIQEQKAPDLLTLRS